MFSLNVPKWVSVVVAAAAVVLMAVGYAISQDTPDEHKLRADATEAGLPTDFVLVSVVGEPYAYFTVGGQVCFMEVFCEEIPPHVAVRAPADWPREYVTAMLYHELGHYAQWREGKPFDEWDADLRGMRAMCARGMNGPEALAGALSAIPNAKIESPRHGNLYRRVDHMRSYGCRARGLVKLDSVQS